MLRKFHIHLPLALNFVCAEWKLWLMVMEVALEERSERHQKHYHWEMS